MQVDIELDCPVYDSARVRQVGKMFDLPLQRRMRERFSAELPGLDETWDIGAIIGPSGSGKTTLARAAYGRHVYYPPRWPRHRALIDCFGNHPPERLTRILTAVGLSSAPSWLKPVAVLSNGERFRCDLARALLLDWPIVVFDEYSSVVDRTVAKIASAATAKAIRANPGLGISRRLVVVTCHRDIVDWLEPDWMLDTQSQILARGRLRRPEIALRCRRTDRSIWTLFKRHHYLTAELHRGARCFLGTIDGEPAAFTAVLPHPHPCRPGWREHRTVCLPEFQGIGIGTAMSEFVASLFVATGKPYFSTTSHPAMIAHRTRSLLWRVCRKPGVGAKAGKNSCLVGTVHRGNLGRVTAGFEYMGWPRFDDAVRLGVLIPASVSSDGETAQRRLC